MAALISNSVAGSKSKMGATSIKISNGCDSNRYAIPTGKFIPKTNLLSL